MDWIRYWDEDGGHWVQWPAQPPAPGLYKAAEDQWVLGERGELVQIITGIESC